MNHPLPDPRRYRKTPPQFSWVDHRLVREHHFEQCSLDAMAFYLFLVTVADARGISYYSQPRLMKCLRLGTARLMQLRAELMDAGLIAYQHPLYQVLSLGPETVAGDSHD